MLTLTSLRALMMFSYASVMLCVLLSDLFILFLISSLPVSLSMVSFNAFFKSNVKYFKFLFHLE